MRTRTFAIAKWPTSGFCRSTTGSCSAKDLEATVKYRYDPNFETGGTFGVNYATMGGRILAFNYRTIFMTEDERLDLHRKFIVDHYLQQFNQETMRPGSSTPAASRVPRSARMRGRVQEGLRALPDHGTAVRRV